MLLIFEVCVFMCLGSVPSKGISFVFSFLYLYSDLSTPDWEVYVFSAGVQFPTGLFFIIIFVYLFLDGHNRLRSICFLYTLQSGVLNSEKKYKNDNKNKLSPLGINTQ